MSVEQATLGWLQQVVIGLNLCPFASHALPALRVQCTDVDTEQDLLACLQDELNLLRANESIETTLLVHPQVLQDFMQYNDFLSQADTLLEELNMVGEFQIASFHPQYLFADSNERDAANYSNRSPYPMLHLLRESSLEKAIAAYPDVEEIPDRNVRLLRDMGLEAIKALL